MGRRPIEGHDLLERTGSDGPMDHGSRLIPVGLPRMNRHVAGLLRTLELDLQALASDDDGKPTKDVDVPSLGPIRAQWRSSIGTRCRGCSLGSQWLGTRSKSSTTRSRRLASPRSLPCPAVLRRGRRVGEGVAIVPDLVRIAPAAMHQSASPSDRTACNKSMIHGSVLISSINRDS